MPFISLLDLLERQWAGQLRQVSLVSEAGVPEEMATAAAEALGHVYGHEEVAVRWPACVAISLTRMAAAGEAFWPRWRAATGRRGNAAGWGRAFLAALDVFGLPRAATAAQSIMLHAGRPAPEPPRRLLDPFGGGISGPEGADLLVFAEDGRELTGDLPPGPVWVAHRRDGVLTSDGPLRTIAEGVLPFGWEHWRLALISLEGGSWLAAASSGAGSRRRPVRGRAGPRLLPGEAVGGVSAPDGSAVLAGPPALWLPRGDWRVTVGHAGDTVRRADPADPWALLPRPLLGTFTVTSSDADGRTGRHTVTIAEGLRVRYDPPIRLFEGDGLAPADVSFHTGPGLTATPQALTLTAAQTTRALTCVASGRTLVLTVRPPHMRVRVDRQWHTAPPRLTPEHRWLRLDLPGLANPPIEVIAGGRAVQELTAHSRGDYPLVRLRDTVLAHGEITLRVRDITLATMSAPLGTTSDPWLCND
ncbi:hypothetical protein GCM10009850_112700 [Nonomuraea monospora]|uniref:Heparinase II/III-like protein n=1 Tax=Nonomuraea monospora TaxID=568818 RepID=A0ABP5PZH6_9ACTN